MYLFILESIFRCTYLYIIFVFVFCEILSAGNKSDLCWAPHHNIFYLNLWWPADQNIGPVQSQSSSADLCRKTPPTRQRQYGEMENCLRHTIIMAAAVLSWSIPPGCVETFSTLYLHPQCSWDVWAVLSPSCGQQRGGAAQVPAGGLRPDREVSSMLHSALVLQKVPSEGS